MTKEQVCSQQIGCLSCPLSVRITGVFCDRLSPADVEHIMNNDQNDKGGAGNEH